MLSKSLRLARYNRAIPSLGAGRATLLRFNSTKASDQKVQSSTLPRTQQPQQPKESKSKEKPHRARAETYKAARESNLSQGLSLSILCRDADIDISTLYSAVDELATSSIPTPFMNGIGHNLFTKLTTLNKDNAIQDSFHFKKLLNTLMTRKIAHFSHILRVIGQLLIEGDYSGALALWIQGLEYTKENPDSFTVGTARVPKHGNKASTPQVEFASAGITSYFLSLFQNKTSADIEFVKLILGDLSSKIGIHSLRQYMYTVRGLEDDKKEFVLSQWRKYVQDTIDLNDVESWTSAMNAAHLQRNTSTEKIINKNLKIAESKNIKLSPEIWAHIMRIYIIDKSIPNALKIFSELPKKNVPLTIELWNELLSAHAKLNKAERLKRVESVWSLLNKSVAPNSQSYFFLIQGYILSDELNKALEVIFNLKKTNPELVNNKIRESMLVGLLNKKLLKEANGLYKLYLEEGFKPDVKFYNNYLTALVKNNDVERASEIFDSLLSDPSVELDAATWTIVIDLNLKIAMASGAGITSVSSQMVSLLKSMQNDGIKLNQSTFTMLISNLVRDPHTNEIGLALFDYLKSTGFQFSQLTYTSLVSSQAAIGNMETALRFFEEGLKIGLKLVPPYYNLIFNGFANQSDLKAIDQFYKYVKGKTEGNTAPNFYTFFFIIRAGYKQKDKKFLDYYLSELLEANLKTLGDRLPKVLTDIERKQLTTVPEPLKQFKTEKPQEEDFFIFEEN